MRILSYFSFGKVQKGVAGEQAKVWNLREDRLINLYGSGFYMIGWKIVKLARELIEN